MVTEMYEKLIAELREYWNDGTEEIWGKAADAIEELQKQLRKEKVDNVNLTGWLAEEHANQCPHYIRNVHDRGDDSLCDRFVCEVKELPRWIPVTERLPEECGRYIVLLKASEDETKHWIEWGLGDDADIILEMFYDADQKIWKTDVGAYNAILSVVNREHNSCVTHWMPLPQPPKGEPE